jgi:hypothetical protein
MGIADDASGLVKVVVSGGEVNRCLLGECLAEALPAVDLAQRVSGSLCKRVNGFHC